MSFEHRQGKPSQSRWIAAAAEEARAVGIEPERVLSRTRDRITTLARARAISKLYSTGKYSLSGIGIAAGLDHTSVRHALLNLDRHEARAARSFEIEREKQRLAATRLRARPMADAPIFVPVKSIGRQGRIHG